MKTHHFTLFSRRQEMGTEGTTTTTPEDAAGWGANHTGCDTKKSHARCRHPQQMQQQTMHSQFLANKPRLIKANLPTKAQRTPTKAHANMPTKALSTPTKALSTSTKANNNLLTKATTTSKTTVNNSL